MDLLKIADNVQLKDGIWFSKNQSDVSYPKDGNRLCFQIEEESFWFNHRNRCIAEAVKNNFSVSDGCFADVGGGNGFLASELEKNGIKTLLIEPGVNGIMNAKSRGLKNLLCATLEDGQFKPGVLNAAGIFDVLEHEKDDTHFLTALNHLLAQGGKLFLTVPTFNCLWSSDDSLSGHYRRYTVSGLAKKLKHAGFDIEYSTYLFSILPLPIFLFRTIPTALGFRKTRTVDSLRHEHINMSKRSGVFLDHVWDWEISTIRGKKKIPFGSSCLVAARKTTACC